MHSDNLEEVLRTLKAEGKHAHVIAGGTGFYELARRGYIPEVKHVVSIMKLGLSYIRDEIDSSQVTIGATTKLQELLESKIGERNGLEAIGDALSEIRPVQVRNVATVGGEICISVPIVDLPTALLACNAKLNILSSQAGNYSISMDDFYVDAFLTKLKYGELVKEVLVQKNPQAGSAFVKFGRTAYDFNLINAATSVILKKEKIDSLRIYLGGIKRVPIRASEFERKLVGKSVDEESIMEAARSAFSKEKFLPSVHGSSEYKYAIIPVVLRDCLLKAYNRASNQDSKR